MKLSEDDVNAGLGTPGLNIDKGGPICLDYSLSDSDLTDDDDSEICCVCNKKSPSEIRQLAGIVIVILIYDGLHEDNGDIYPAAAIYNCILGLKSRDNVVVATKCRFPMSTEPNDQGLSRRHIIKCCEDSLERLQTNYIDLYQTHMWDDATPIEETLRTLDDLVRCDRFDILGFQICWHGFISMQQQYNLLVRHPELEEFQVCKTEGLGVLPWSPLRSGMLTGKYKRDEKMDPKSGRKTAAQVALRWLLQKDVVSSIIIGATSIKQLEENMSVGTGWCISKEDMETLDEASKPESESSYPYEMSRFGNTSRVNRFNPKPIVANI
ncbi:unnamed protein product [Mytilus coruscus]|uniref:NADP-dependent oxidoreductase domain-containing protein n=1 Tax=Mytilus coruscus TaxID=42192 RepID=A0A6J8CN30_MYTCO|nr:unnamed protein product [Mytilus coruscus]